MQLDHRHNRTSGNVWMANYSADSPKYLSNLNIPVNQYHFICEINKRGECLFENWYFFVQHKKKCYLEWRVGGNEEYGDMNEDKIQHVNGESNNDNNVLKKTRDMMLKMLINIRF